MTHPPLDDPHHDREAGSRDAGLDASEIDDVRIRAVRPLVSPAVLHTDLPLTSTVVARVRQWRRDIAAVLRGQDDRLMVIVGPCSVHNTEQALHYAHHLHQATQQLDADLLLVMRAHFGRSHLGRDWKGFIQDPRLDGSLAINAGLREARQLLLDVAHLGLPTGTEFTDLLTPQYLADLITWSTLDGRSTESASHRQLASGLSCAVGFKNSPDGSVSGSVAAIEAARRPHTFMGMTKMGLAAIFDTSGNEDTHLILRGGSEPNHDAPAVDAACRALRQAHLPERVMIDCAHANAGWEARAQIRVAHELGSRIAQGETRILGLMIESHLHEGRQQLDLHGPMTYGVSITDPCLGWSDTEALLHTLAGAVRQRRLRRTP